MPVANANDEYLLAFINKINNEMCLERVNPNRRRDLQSLSGDPRVLGEKLKDLFELPMVPIRLHEAETLDAVNVNAQDIFFGFPTEGLSHPSLRSSPSGRVLSLQARPSIASRHHC